MLKKYGFMFIHFFSNRDVCSETCQSVKLTLGRYVSSVEFTMNNEEVISDQ